MLASEAALYCGATRVIFTGDEKPETVSGLIDALFIQGTKYPEGRHLACGYIKMFQPDTAEAKKSAEKELRLYIEKMGRHEFRAAGVHLARWNSLLGNADKITYAVNLWMVNLLAGNLAGAGETVKNMSTSTEQEKAVSGILKICQLLYEGKTGDARSAFMAMKSDPSISGDMEYLKIIFDLAVNGDITAVKRAADKKKTATIIPRERYLYLVVSFSALLDSGAAREAVHLIPDGSFSSEREMLLAMSVSGKVPAAGSSSRFDGMIALAKKKGSPDEISDIAVALAAGDEGYDELSPFPILLLAGYFTDAGQYDQAALFLESIDLKGMTEKSGGLDSMLLYKKAREIALNRHNYSLALALCTEMKKYSESAPFMKAVLSADSAGYLFILKKYKEAYNTGLEAEKYFREAGATDVRLSLLMINLLTVTGQYGDAQKRAAQLAGNTTLTQKEKFVYTLQLTLIELDRLGKLKSATTADAAQFEKLFSTVLDVLKKDTTLAAEPGTDVIVQLVFEEFVNYRMKTGSYGEAHNSSEMKKLAMGSAVSGTNFLKDADVSKTDKLQKSLPEGTVYVNIAKNKNDIFIWMIDSKEKKAQIIEGGYEQAGKIIDRYRADAAAGKDLAAVSKELKNFLAPVYAVLKDRKRIIFCCDSFTENLPLEIAGDGKMLCEEYSIVYMASPLLLSAPVNEKTGTVQIVSYDAKNRSSYLERAAIRESGSSYSIESSAKEGVVHIAGDVNYSITRKKFVDGSNNPIAGKVSGSSMIYMTAGDMSGASVTDMVLASGSFTKGNILVNNAAVRGLNSAAFVGSYYSELSKGSGSEKSFLKSGEAMRSGKYKHPANWSGIRLYMRTLPAGGK